MWVMQYYAKICRSGDFTKYDKASFKNTDKSFKCQKKNYIQYSPAWYTGIQSSSIDQYMFSKIFIQNKLRH